MSKASPTESSTVQTESPTVQRPSLIDSITAPGDRATTSPETISARPTTNYNNVDFGVFNFGEAFNRASNAGLNEFIWNGKKYTTQRAIPAPGPDGRNYSIADTLLSNSNITPTDWWISKQWEIPTATTIGVNPWPAIHAQERNEYVTRRKQGGKVEKENEVNKKYIKDSEKAGKEASKKMTDLKNRHKAELKKIK